MSISDLALIGTVAFVAFGLWKFIDYVAGLHRKVQQLEAAQHESRETVAEQILAMWNIRMDPAAQMRRLALYEHINAEFQANPAMVKDIIYKFISEQKAKGK